MNWKDKLLELKIGDFCILTKPNPLCKGDCCKKIIGEIGCVLEINESVYGKYLVKFNENFSCNMPKKCLEKVYKEVIK